MSTTKIEGKELTVNISPGEAMSVLQAHLEADAMWRANAIQLLELAAAGKIDENNMRQTCADHAEKGLTL